MLFCLQPTLTTGFFLIWSYRMICSILFSKFPSLMDEWTKRERNLILLLHLVFNPSLLLHIGLPSSLSALSFVMKWRLKWFLSGVEGFDALRSLSPPSVGTGLAGGARTPYVSLSPALDRLGLDGADRSGLDNSGPGGCGPFLSSVQRKKSHWGILYAIMIYWMTWYMCNYWEWLTERRHIISHMPADGNQL